MIGAFNILISVFLLSKTIFALFTTYLILIFRNWPHVSPCMLINMALWSVISGYCSAILVYASKLQPIYTLQLWWHWQIVGYPCINFMASDVYLYILCSFFLTHTHTHCTHIPLTHTHTHAHTLHTHTYHPPILTHTVFCPNNCVLLECLQARTCLNKTLSKSSNSATAMDQSCSQMR